MSEEGKPKKIIPAPQRQREGFSFVDLPGEIRNMIYKLVGDSTPPQILQEDLPRPTNEEFRSRHPLLFLNHRFKIEFLGYFGRNGFEYYICISLDMPVRSMAACLDNPSIDAERFHLAFLRIDMNTTGMSNERVDGLFEFLTWCWPEWYFSEINIVYGDLTKSELGVWAGQYSCVIVNRDLEYRNTFKSFTINEEGRYAVKTEVTETDFWEVHDDFMEEEHARLVKAAQAKGRWRDEEYVLWWNADGTLVWPVANPNSPQ